MNVFFGEEYKSATSHQHSAVSIQPSAYFLQKHRLRYAQAKLLAES
ncbi:MAG: hypothetical protein F6K26_26530 [Moorea sp. SIO2I5]|nr:hypothetical protein [Moorena sp. SIO2I5]